MKKDKHCVKVCKEKYEKCKDKCYPVSPITDKCYPTSPVMDKCYPVSPAAVSPAMDMMKMPYVHVTCAQCACEPKKHKKHKHHHHDGCC